ncbi:MAG TPA: hypothetical protein VEH52_02150 [Gaiellaceae bacterium]|nr:hypothetical protein [Gaiellaceae bacterium]
MGLVLPLVVVLGLVLVGLLQARRNTLEPAVLRYRTWQLILGGVLLVAAAVRTLGSASAPSVPVGGSMVKMLPVVLLLVLALLLVLRRRRKPADADF